MTSAHAPTAFFTISSVVLAVLIVLFLSRLLARTAANHCIAAFLALLIPSPLMLVAHGRIALAMVGLGVVCVVPAYLLAEDHHDDGRGDGRGPDPLDPDPGPGFGPDLWDEFERDFWSHVERHRELVNA